MSLTFTKKAHLRKRKDYEIVARACQKRAGQWMYIDIRFQPSSFIRSRLGITVTKKFGKAHDRNRFKRLVRESFRHLQHHFISPIDMVIRPRGKHPLAAKGLHMQDILTDMRMILCEQIRSQ